ncbi:hypothetical protein BD414DRAFT_485565 [Trametes punicea]|nr:hypothetical protein BD414DRAFT_485565 [Trametes punicea]
MPHPPPPLHGPDTDPDAHATLPPTHSYSDNPNLPQDSPALPKKKHVCQICTRAFSTSGHLSRHTRIHTGERNHKCPFPGCETRCSRQDNLQQQSVPFPRSLSFPPSPSLTAPPSACATLHAARGPVL